MTDLRELRHAARISLHELAHKTGINYPKLSYGERGVMNLTAEERGTELSECLSRK